MEDYNTVVLAIAMILVGVFGNMAFTDPVVIEKQVVVEKEIVTLVEVPMPANTSIELIDVRNKLYAREIRKLENDAIELVEEELDSDDIEDFIESDKNMVFRSFSIDDDETDVTILSYDFDEDDEDKAEVTMELIVKYSLREGLTGSYRKVVYVTATYSLDDGDAEVKNLVYS